jgi:hypothetical protein
LTACPSCWIRTNVVPQGLSRPDRIPSGLDVFRISTSRAIAYLRRRIPHQDHTLTAMHAKGLSSSPTPNPPDMPNRLYEDAVSTKPNHAFQATIPFTTSLCLSHHGSRLFCLPTPAMVSATHSRNLVAATQKSFGKPRRLNRHRRHVFSPPCDPLPTNGARDSSCAAMISLQGTTQLPSPLSLYPPSP